jgi:hypothetical protein
MKKLLIILVTIVLSVAFISCDSFSMFPRDVKIRKSINRINEFPNIPNNYEYFDYLSMAQDLDDIVFYFAKNESAITPSYIFDNQDTWFPIGYWIDQSRQPSTYDPLTTGYLKRSFGIPTYVGDTRIASTGTESIVNLGMVLGSTYAGIDKSNQEFSDIIYNFVEMTMSAYDTGTKLVTNGGIQGQSFWYDIFPQILFARLYDEYDNIEFMREMVLNGADEWLEALPYFLKDGEIDFEFVGFNVVLESPTVVGEHIEPPNGGLAFLFYSAYEMTKDSKYLDGAKFVLDYLESYQKNPNYEAMTDYAPFVAAALNYKYNTNYDIGKFLDFLFEEDSSFRPGWSVMTGSFGEHEVAGLVGQAGDYAFSMNSFHLASTLVPMLKYDSRYVDDIGKYVLNLVNNAKVFFPHEMPLGEQSMSNFLRFDKYGSICYEGFRNQFAEVNGYAMGDGTTMFDGIPSDLSLYSSAFTGFLGGLVSETNVEGILQLDLNKTDSFGDKAFQYYSYYNPYSEEKIIEFFDEEAYDLFDVLTKTVVAKNITGEANISIPAETSRLLVKLPGDAEIRKEGFSIYANDILITKYQAAINILNLRSRQELTQETEIFFSNSVPLSDSIVNMKIYFNEIKVYDGSYLDSYYYDKADLPDTDYTLRVEIITADGLKDSASKRVICR